MLRAIRKQPLALDSTSATIPSGRSNPQYPQLALFLKALVVIAYRKHGGGATTSEADLLVEGAPSLRDYQVGY